ncbi:hypothetical protein QCA50_014525 [Cerrena zonata]|uniref:Amino acid permease/ SLC12A domain-containing protein n=1 Tax=Cerrena zonata TaxID=2478898 RepID=A0AAW0FY83_9APHY
MSSIHAGNGIRVRPAPSRAGLGRVHYAPPPAVLKIPKTLRQRLRIQQFQRRWKNIKQDLPPQLSERHIGMISIGGVIGTGLFLGSGAALKHGGPIGALLGYSVIGTVVYCLCVSVGEMIAFMPNVGGVVGLADLYVDPALGFSLGWAAWYNWSVTLPAEISAAAIVVQFWDINRTFNPAYLTGIFLFLAVAVNCFSSRVYGEFEFWFSTVKVMTIVLIIIVCLILDLGAGAEGFVGFKNWKTPFADSYLGIDGSLGRFLGFWAVLMQASFSFFGSEVPGIAAGEVHDATRNVPRALQRVWIRIILFYVGGIFCAGLLVPANDSRLDLAQTGASSPFVIALDKAKVRVLPHIVNAAILLSAWSAAASDVYISSRFLFFLARCHHAPQFLASLIRHPWHETAEDSDESEEEDLAAVDDDELPVIDIRRFDEEESMLNARQPFRTENESMLMQSGSHDKEYSDTFGSGVEVHVTEVSSHIEDLTEEHPERQKISYFVLPLAAVLVSSSVGLLSFLGTSHIASSQTAFNWLVAVASVASLQSWAGLLFTYIRWHQGTVYAENKHKSLAMHDEESRKVIADIEKIKEHRHRGQPYLAWYAFGLCMIVLFTNGWSVFVHGGWKIAEIPANDGPMPPPDVRESDPVSQFLSSYIPLPFFLLLTFGYKLIYQTKMVKLEEMSFSRENIPEPVERKPTTRREGFLRWLLVS